MPKPLRNAGRSSRANGVVTKNAATHDTMATRPATVRDSRCPGLMAKTAAKGIDTAIRPLYLTPAVRPAAAPASTKALSVGRSDARSDSTSASAAAKVSGTSVRAKWDSRTCIGMTAISPAAMSAALAPQRRPAWCTRAMVAVPMSADSSLAE